MKWLPGVSGVHCSMREFDAALAIHAGEPCIDAAEALIVLLQVAVAGAVQSAGLRDRRRCS